MTSPSLETGFSENAELMFSPFPPPSLNRRTISCKYNEGIPVCRDLVLTDVCAVLYPAITWLTCLFCVSDDCRTR